MFFVNERQKRRGSTWEGERDTDELEGVEEEETVIRIFCMRKESVFINEKRTSTYFIRVQKYIGQSFNNSKYKRYFIGEGDRER